MRIIFWIQKMFSLAARADQTKKRVFRLMQQKRVPLPRSVKGAFSILAACWLVPLRSCGQNKPLTSLLSPLPIQSPICASTHNAPGEKPSERIKNRISVHDFVSQYVELDSQGRGHCPFHDDQHKSFSVNKQGNHW